MDYLIDGNINSFFSLIAGLESPQHETRRIVQKDHYQMSLLTPFTLHKTDPQKAEAFVVQLERDIGPKLLRSILAAYLSDDPARFDAMDRFIFKARSEGAKVYHQIHPDVTPLVALERAVQRERHRFLGLLRFKRLKGDIYYASYAPNFDISVLLVDHFAERMPGEYFIIHDVKRQKACFYNKHRWVEAELRQTSDQYHQEELAFQSFWQKYHSAIAISERKNLKLQQSFMPKKYWKYLPEMAATPRASG